MIDQRAPDAGETIDAMLILVIVSAVVIRFWNLANQPWVDLEDVQHIGYAKDLVQKGVLGQGATYLGWTIIGALTWLIVPSGPYGELFLSAMFGSLAVVLTYVFASACHSRLTGLLASAVLAASLIHIHFSRWAQPQAAAIFFVLAAFVLYERARRTTPSMRRLYLAGAVGGFGSLCHLSVGPLPAMLVIAEAISDGAASIAERARRALVMGIALASPLVAAEVIVRVLRLTTGRSDIGSPIGHLWIVPNYAAYGGGAVQSIQRQDPLLFWRSLWESEGGLFVVAAIAGWAWLTAAIVRRRSRNEAHRLRQGYGGQEASSHILMWLFITGGFVASIGYTLSSGMRVFRYIVPVVPATAMAVAVFLSLAVTTIRARLGPQGLSRLVAAVCALVLASGYVRAHQRVAFSTGFEAVWSIVRQSGAKRVAFVGSPGKNDTVDVSPWELLTAYIPAETVMLARPQDVNDLRPAPQLVIVGMLTDAPPPEIRGFHAMTAIWLRMPNFDARPVQDWDAWGHRQKVFILRE